MSFSLRRTISLVCVLALFAVVSPQIASAGEDIAHVVSGVVKHVDKGTKTMVVKADDGTEHTIKWTGKTSWEGAKGTGKAVKEGSKVSVKYTEKSGEKTAVGVKDVSKDTANAVK